MTEIDRLARIMCEGDGANWDASHFGETANGEDPESQRNYWRDTVCTILADLAENPPQCAVEAMAIASTAVWLREGVWDCMEDDARALWRKGARPAFTAAINAIREAK